MTAIIPMFLQSPYFVGLGGYQNDLAVRQQTQQQASQHSEVMGALRELRRDTITVCVLSSAIAPLCVAALARIEPPAIEYDRDMGKWHARISRIRAWQYNRERKREKTEKAAAEGALIQKKLVRFRRWWRSEATALRMARDAAREQLIWRDHSYHRSLRIGFGDSLRDQMCETRPKMPDGYGDVPAIRDLQSAASISPDAQLTVPVETIKKLTRWSA